MSKAIIFLTKLVITACIALLFASCHNVNFNNGEEGSGNVTTENRNIAEDFKSIEVSHGIEVVVEQSNNKSVSVEADDNLQKLIETKVENGVLQVRASKSYNSSTTPKVTVKIPVVNGLTATSGASITSENTLVSDNLAVKSSSGSDITVSVEADALTLETSSGSHISANGKALRLETASSSGSGIDAEKLMANDITSSASSGSETSVSPIISLTAKASSGSSVSYHKIPKTINKEESSGGSVSQQ